MSNDKFDVTQNSLTELVVEAIGPRRLITFQTEFVDFLTTIGFLTDDQAPFVTRNLSLIVEEFPLGEVPSLSFFLPIEVVPVNDRPIFNSRNEDILGEAMIAQSLQDYLPQSTNNPGFNASFVVSESDVTDVDRQSPEAADFIGLAVTSTSALESLGVWQYRNTADTEWIEVPDNISSCTPLLLNPNQNIRFSPSPNRDKLDGVSSVVFRVWDGSSRDIYTDCVNGTLVVTEGEWITILP